MSKTIAKEKIFLPKKEIISKSRGKITIIICLKVMNLKRWLMILALIALLISTFSICVFGLSKMGSRSEEVRSIQKALSDKGYSVGGVDGIFGTKTKNAVIRFQKDNGLTPDGVAGPKTLQALGIKNASSSSYGGFTATEYNLLARIISAEARGEPYLGQVAVGAVILNRIEHPSFPNSLSGVIYQKGAFSCLDDGQFYQSVADSAYSAARDAINGLDPSGGAIYYYNPSTATSKWIFSRPVITSIGKHRFCS